jgi:integrase
VVLRLALAEARTRKKWAGDIAAIVPTVKVTYQPREVWLIEHQAEQLLTRIASRRRLWVLLAMFGGLCLGEVERLQWEHVDLGRGWMRVPGTKRTSRWRSVPIAPRLIAALRAAAPAKRAGPVVSHWRNVRRDLARACDLAKVPRVTPNDLRRTFASWLKNNGVDSAYVARLLGHSSTKMVDLVYGRLSPETLAATVLRLPIGEPCVTSVQEPRAHRATNETAVTEADPDDARKHTNRKRA